MRFVETLKGKNMYELDRMELLVSYLDLSSEEFHKAIVLFANNELDSVELAKNLALEYFEHGYIEINGLSNGMMVYEDVRFFDYLVETFKHKLK